MIKPQIKERSSNIVLIGDFNPHIFQPAWFVSQKLIGIQEGESAKVEIVHSDLAIFSLEWLRLEVTRTRLLAVTRDDRFHEILKDLIVGTFSILSHTPVRMMGINNTWECIINDEETWHNVGHRLAPKDIWNKVMDNPGLRSLTIESKMNFKETYKNNLKVAVGISNQKLGFKIHVNDHYEINEFNNKFVGSDEIIRVLKNEWDNSQNKSIEIRDKLFEELP